MSTSELEPLSAAELHLLTAATEAFAELGFGGTSTRDIAARAQRSQTAVYIHNNSKEELLFAISLRGHHGALDCLRSAAEASADPVERIRGMVFAFSRWHLTNAKLGRVAQYEFHAMTPPHRKEIVSLRREMRRTMGAAIEAGITSGDLEVTDVMQTADALLSLSIDVVRWFDPDRRRSPQSIARHYAELAVRMLRRCPSTGSEASSTNLEPTRDNMHDK